MRRVLAAVSVVVLCVLAGAVPASASAAGSISGTVTAAVGGSPLADIEVCAYGESNESSVGGDCDETAADGSYSLTGLIPDSYSVYFWPPLGSEYAPELYDGKFRQSEAAPVPVADGVDTPGVDATLDLGGAISGRVVDAGSGVGVPGIEACGIDENEEFFLCGETDDNGDYTIYGLRAGAFEVAFLDFGSERHEGDYLAQVYNGGNLQLVSVTSGVTTTGINATLTKGGSISGTVTDALSGAGVIFSPVCVREAGSGEIYECVPTDTLGRYTISPLPAGPFKVWFSSDLQFGVDDYIPQYFSDAATFAAATVVTIVPPGAITGIDARLVSRKAPPPPPIVAPSPVTAPVVKPKPKRVCPKGKRLVKRKGKVRCVRKHRKVHRRGHHAKRDRSGRILRELAAAGLR